MQALAYSLDEPELKELYLELLASASDDRVADAVHPSFVEVLKQLSAAEVQILVYPLGSDFSLPVMQVRASFGDSKGWIQIANHRIETIPDCPGLDADTPHLATYIDNWVRQGLVDVSYETYLHDNEAYHWTKDDSVFKDWTENKPDRYESIVAKRGVMTATNFGLSFANAVGMERSESLFEHSIKFHHSPEPESPQ